MKSKTRIMASTGPTLNTAEEIYKAAEIGAKWFRMSLGYAHNDHFQHGPAIRALPSEFEAEIVYDLPSSRPRTGQIEDQHFQIGDRVAFWDEDEVSHPPVFLEQSVSLFPGSRACCQASNLSTGCGS